MQMKRRDNKGRILKEGESQREDGRYMYRYKDASGKRMTEYSWRLVETDPYPVGKKKDISLREKEENISKDLMSGIVMSGATITLDELFERFIKTKKRLEENVKGTYIGLYNNHIKSTYVGSKSIKMINKNDVLNIYEEMAEADLSNGTIHNVHNNVLFPALEYALDNDWIRKNPAKDCLREYPYDPVNRREALTLDEQKRFIEFLSKDNVYSKYLPLVILIMETALRRGEVLGLTWNDVDLRKGIIKVNHQLHYYSIKGKYVFMIGEPKTTSGYREIPLSNVALSVLNNLKQTEYFNSVGSGIEINGYSNFIFLNSRKDNVMIPRQLGKSLAAACNKYNKIEKKQAEKEGRQPVLLPIITAHHLRHTACTRMAECGVDIKALQMIMGHKKATTTMNIYNHADLHRITKEIDKVNTRNPLYLLG